MHLSHHTAEQPAPDVYARGMNIERCFPRITSPAVPLIDIQTVSSFTSGMPPNTLENALMSMPPVSDVIATSAKITEELVTDTLQASTARNLLDIATAATLPDLGMVGAAPSAGLSAGQDRGGAVRLILMDEGVARVWHLDSAINTPDREAIAFHFEASTRDVASGKCSPYDLDRMCS